MFILPLKGFSSARVCKVNGKLVIYSNMIFYGTKASDSTASKCANEIHNMFNSPNMVMKIDGKSYPINFQISYQVESESDALKSISINTRVSNNYVRLEEKANNETDGRSNHNLSGNCGFYAIKDGLGSSTTCAHEYAHGLGLSHYNDRKSGAGKDGDLRGTGVPGIMAARGFIVDKEYQYNPNANPGAAGGTINPINRKVLPRDIKDLELDKLKFDSDGCANLGNISGKGYKKNGAISTGEGSALWNGINYLYDSYQGNLKKPQYCTSNQ